MNIQAVREIIVEALAYGNVSALRDNGWTEDFLLGARDVPIADLEFDSLAEMEFCIAIEVNAGVSVVPDDLRAIGSLARLADRIVEETE